MEKNILKKKFYFVLTLIILSLIISSCRNNNEINNSNNNEYQKVRMTLATSGAENGINTIVAKKIAEMVSLESNGNVIIEVYPNEQLAGGNTTKGVSMISDGAIDLAVYTSGTLATIDKRMPIATLPWTFTDYDEAKRIIDNSGGNYYRKILSEHGIVYLGYIHNGFRQISNNRNIVKSPEDLKGMKIRILGNEGYWQFFKLFGAEPMPMSRSEMSMALKQGYIDGHDMGIFQSDFDKPNEMEKYMTIWNYAYETYIFMINSKTFNNLEPKTQELLRQKSKEACEWGRDWLEKNEQNIKNKFLNKGVTITELSSEEIDIFKEKVSPLINQLKARYGDEACTAFEID